jgi:putative aminopeptidase FrvX
MLKPHPYLAQAKKYEKPMVAFLRDMVEIPSESGHEREVIERIKQEMKAVNAFDRIWTDKMGNLLAQVVRHGRHRRSARMEA